MFIFIETKLFTRLADEHLSDEAESISGPILKKIKEEIDG